MVRIDRSMQTTMPGNAPSQWWACNPAIAPTGPPKQDVGVIHKIIIIVIVIIQIFVVIVTVIMVMMDPEAHLNLCILIWGANWIIPVDALRKVNIAKHLLQLWNPRHLSGICSWGHAASREQCYGLKLISWLERSMESTSVLRNHQYISVSQDNFKSLNQFGVILHLNHDSMVESYRRLRMTFNEMENCESSLPKFNVTPIEG